MGNEKHLSTVPVSAPVRAGRGEGVLVGETTSKAVSSGSGQVVQLLDRLPCCLFLFRFLNSLSTGDKGVECM